MVQSHEIREHVAKYLAGEVSLAALERWLNAASPIVVDPDDEAFQLAAAVSLLVSERHDGILEAKEFRSELSRVLNDVVESIGIDNAAAPVRSRLSASPAVIFRPPQTVWIAA